MVTRCSLRRRPARPRAELRLSKSLAGGVERVFMTYFRVRALASVCALVTASLAWGQEEGGTAGQPAASLNVTSYQMRPVTADVENTDQQRLNADADQDNWRLHGRTYDNQRFSPLIQIDASNVKKLKPVALIQTGMANAMESTPLEIDGVLFVETASNLVQARSEERRVGKECRSWGWRCK